MPNCGSDIFFKEMGRQAEEIQDSEFSKVHWFIGKVADIHCPVSGK